MKILQVSHGLPPRENAGVELYTYYLSKSLVRLNHAVHIFCREEDPEREEFSTSHGEMDGLGVTRVVNNLTKIADPASSMTTIFLMKSSCSFLGQRNRISSIFSISLRYQPIC